MKNKMLFTFWVFFVVSKVDAQEVPLCQIDSSKIYQYNIGDNSRDLVETSSNFYNSLGQVVIENFKRVDDATKLLVNDYQYLNTYDQFGDKTLVLERKWNATLSVWENASQVISAFDENHQIIEQKKCAWIKEKKDWVNRSLVVKNYNEYGKIVANISKTWNNDINCWNDQEKLVYLYDYQNRNNESVKFAWQGNTWQRVSKSEFIFDNQGNRLAALISNYSGASDIAKLVETDSFFYDQFNNMLELRKYKLNGNSLVLTAKRSFNYDKFGRIIGGTKSSLWDETNGYFVDRVATELYGSDGTSKISLENLEAQIQIYPIPNAEKLTAIAAKEASYSIYDRAGKLVMEGIFKVGENSISVKDWKSGAYVLRSGSSIKEFVLR